MEQMIQDYVCNPILILAILALLLQIIFQIHTVRKPKDWKWWLLHFASAGTAVGMFLLRYHLQKNADSVSANIALAALIGSVILLFATMELNTRHDEKNK